MGGTGLAQSPESPGKQGVGSKRVADSVALDPDLAKIVAAWPAMSKAAKKRIVAELRKPRRKR